jgi:hypothetical protein
MTNLYLSLLERMEMGNGVSVHFLSFGEERGRRCSMSELQKTQMPSETYGGKKMNTDPHSSSRGSLLHCPF